MKAADQELARGGGEKHGGSSSPKNTYRLHVLFFRGGDGLLSLSLSLSLSFSAPKKRTLLQLTLLRLSSH